MTPYRDGWSGLFATAFERSRNPMVLANAQRAIMDANPALLALLGQTRDQVTGRPMQRIVSHRPWAEDDWVEAMAKGQFFGVTELVHADGHAVAVQWAASTETVTGRRLTLFVALSVSQWGARFRRSSPPEEPPRALTPRQREIVALVALGASGPEIAEELKISPETVRTHMRNAMDRLGARSRAQLVAKALGNGLTLD